MWWFIPVIPAFGRLRQVDYEFKASLGYIVRLCLKPLYTPKKGEDGNFMLRIFCHTKKIFLVLKNKAFWLCTGGSHRWLTQLLKRQRSGGSRLKASLGK
jgi:hypothetical protein